MLRNFRVWLDGREITGFVHELDIEPETWERFGFSGDVHLHDPFRDEITGREAARILDEIDALPTRKE